MAMDDLNLFPDDNIPKDGKERKDGGECGLAVDNEERDMIDLEAIREVAHSGPALVRMSDDHYFVSTIDQLLEACQRECNRRQCRLETAYRGQLVDVTLNPPYTS